MKMVARRQGPSISAICYYYERLEQKEKSLTEYIPTSGKILFVLIDNLVENSYSKFPAQKRKSFY